MTLKRIDLDKAKMSYAKRSPVDYHHRETRSHDDGLVDIAQAEQKNTLKQVIEWGNEKCNHYPEYGLKRECEICWAELEKEK